MSAKKNGLWLVRRDVVSKTVTLYPVKRYYFNVPQSHCRSFTVNFHRFYVCVPSDFCFNLGELWNYRFYSGSCVSCLFVDNSSSNYPLDDLWDFSLDIPS